jgi:hypothetical protein
MKQYLTHRRGVAAALIVFFASTAHSAGIYPVGTFYGTGEVVLTHGSRITACNVQLLGTAERPNGARVTSTTFSGVDEICGQLSMTRPWLISPISPKLLYLYDMALETPHGACEFAFNVETAWNNASSQLQFVDAPGSTCRMSMTVRIWPTWTVY